MSHMFVVKRDGKTQPVLFDKITARIQKLCYGLNADYVDSVRVAQKVCLGVYKGVSTSELDELAAETAAHLTAVHPDYGKLAARIVVSNLHKDTQKVFSDVCTALFNYEEPKIKKPSPMLDRRVYDFIMENADQLNSAIVYDRDYSYDYFGLKTLQRAYLMKLHGKIVERPQHMLMRVSCGIHFGDIESTLETYNLLSCKWFTHATPTLFNAGTPKPQMSSCFLLTMKEDSVEGIYESLKNCAMISKYSGGIGMACHNVRASGSYIRGTGGEANGLVPMMRVFNNTARFINQGGKRNGSFAMYLEPWHADIHAFLDLRKNHGVEEARARDLFYGLWVPDLFMKRIETNGSWSLFCPNEAPGLADVWGKKFEALYNKYESEAGLARKIVPARQLWQSILEAQTETGTPYILYKDACNGKSNQQNLGTIHSSNLCTEIIEYTAPDEVAVCNLASIALPKFVILPRSASSPSARDIMSSPLAGGTASPRSSAVYHMPKSPSLGSFDLPTGMEQPPAQEQLVAFPVNGQTGYFDLGRLFEVTKVITRNLNKVIDINFYPIKEAENSNLRHRPIGLGVQGLADAFALLHLPFESPGAIELNKEIFETIYFAAMTSSMELAKSQGPYSSFKGSPLSEGKFSFDLWGAKTSGRWDWDSLRRDVMEHGARNSLLVAPMPTASTSQILGNNECFEPYTSNLYVRRTLAGEFVCVSRHLLKDLVKLGLWTPQLKNRLIAENGSIANIREIPQHLKDIYKTAWEIKGKTLIDMAADRGPFIDQSQSFNVFMTDINFGKLTSMHFYSWKKGLKTGMYYLRSKAATDAIKFTVDQKALREEDAAIEKIAATGPAEPQNVEQWRAEREQAKKDLTCSLDNPEGCLACGS